MRGAMMLLTSVILLSNPALAGPGGSGKDNLNRDIAAAAKDDKQNIKNIRTEDDYWGSVDEVAHFGVVAIEIRGENGTFNERMFSNKWDKNWDRLQRTSEHLFEAK